MSLLSRLLPESEERGPDAQEVSLTTSGRRRFLKWLGLGLATITSGLALIPVIAAIFSPVIRKLPDVWIDLGPLEHFPLGEMLLVTFWQPHRVPWDGLSKKTAAYVQRTPAQVIVFSVHCAHMDCPVSWFATSGLFMCPCHGGVYNANGAVVGGPPPRGLFRYEHKVEKGHLHILAGHLPLLHAPLSPKGAAEDTTPPEED
jgi:menaquinol-cytochrome c reductase iron-sulfur subunit